MKRSFVGLVVAVLFVVSAVWTSSARAAEIPLPGTPPVACGAYYPGDCLITTRNGGLTLSPKVVRAGGELTGEITNRCSDGKEPCPVGWGALTGLGKIVHGCRAKDSSCVVKISRKAASTAYSALNVTVTSGQGPGYSSDYYAILGLHQSVIEGAIKNKDKSGAAGVTVDMYGTGNGPRYAAITGADGHYAADVKAGHYRVVPSGRSVPSKGGEVKFTPDSATVHAPANGKATANFELDGGLVVTLKLSKSSVPADGSQVVDATVHVTQYGKPLAGQVVNLDPQAEGKPDSALTTGPRVLLCQNGGKLWPSGTLQDPDGISVDQTTDAKGNITFTLFVGTVPGSWKLTAWAKNAAGELITADTRNSADDQTLTVAPLGAQVSTVDAFVGEYNTVASSTSQFANVSGNVGSILGGFWQGTAADAQLHGLAYAPVQGNSGAVLVYQATATPAIAKDGTVTARQGDEVLEPSEWTAVAGVPVTSLDQALQQGRLTQLPTFAQWTAGQSVNGWTGQAQTMTATSHAFQYFGWPLPSSNPGSCY